MRAMLLHVMGLNEYHSVGRIPNCGHYTLVFASNKHRKKYWSLEKGTKVECVSMPDGMYF